MPVGNHTLPTNILNNCDGLLYCLSDWAYDVTNGMFWALMLLAIIVILGLQTSRWGSTRSISYAGVSGLFGALILTTLNLMSWWIASGFIIFGIIGIVILIMGER